MKRTINLEGKRCSSPGCGMPAVAFKTAKNRRAQTIHRHIAAMRAQATARGWNLTLADICRSVTRLVETGQVWHWADARQLDLFSGRRSRTH
jgi:hypothetical protein